MKESLIFLMGYMLGTFMLVGCVALVENINESKNYQLCLEAGASVEYCENI